MIDNISVRASGEHENGESDVEGCFFYRQQVPGIVKVDPVFSPFPCSFARFLQSSQCLLARKPIPGSSQVHKQTPVANPFQYEGGYFESSTGLVKFGTRYYNPNLGRWTQQDPSNRWPG